MIKTFVLDTNVLLHNAASLESFKDNDIVIPMPVVEELDKFKKNSDELGRNARMVIRNLDRLRGFFPDTPGELSRGIPLELISRIATGKLYVLSSGQLPKEGAVDVDRLFDDELTLSYADNRILRIACALRNTRESVIVVSKDINLRLKADALGLKAMDFEREKVKEDRIYTGIRRTLLSDELMKKFSGEKVLSAKEAGLENAYNNEFVIFSPDKPTPETEKWTLAGRCRFGKVTALDNRTDLVWKLRPRNIEQRMALEILTDPAIHLVTLVGGAGTGKTLLALAAALQLTLTEEKYERILVSRPIIPLGNDIGFLPGKKEDKLSSWMQPIFDNLSFLLDSPADRKNAKNGVKMTPESLRNAGKLDLEAVTYIRGRSIAGQFIIIDEAQNLTPHEVKTIISRCGAGSKIVLTGDPAQIDNPYLDASGNGLTYAAEHFKGEAIFGHIQLAKSERSDLAALAARLL